MPSSGEIAGALEEIAVADESSTYERIAALHPPKRGLSVEGYLRSKASRADDARLVKSLRVTSPTPSVRASMRPTPT